MIIYFSISKDHRFLYARYVVKLVASELASSIIQPIAIDAWIDFKVDHKSRDNFDLLTSINQTSLALPPSALDAVIME